MNDIYHYGTPRHSGRYPWGSGKDPYQSSGGKPGLFKKKKIASTREEAINKTQQSNTSREQKEKALKAGTATDILKFQGQLTNQEMQQAVERLRLENQLRSYSSAEIETMAKKMDRYARSIKNTVEWGKTGAELYNLIAAMYNATEEGKNKPLTKIDISGGKKK